MSFEEIMESMKRDAELCNRRLREPNNGLPLKHGFQPKTSSRPRDRQNKQRKLRRDEILELAVSGYTRSAARAKMGISRDNFNRLVKQEKLSFREG